MVPSIIKEIIQNNSNIFLINSSDFREEGNRIWNPGFRDVLQQREGKVLFSFLKSCSKSALILPEYLCHTYARSLSKHSKHVYVGKEIYPTSASVVFVAGLVPNFVIKRLKNIATGGIWDWHPKLEVSRHGFKKSQGSLNPEKPNMSGNILVVFSILPCGFLLSMIGFACEIVRRFIGKLRDIDSSVVKKILRKHSNSEMFVEVFSSSEHVEVHESEG